MVSFFGYGRREMLDFYGGTAPPGGFWAQDMLLYFVYLLYLMCIKWAATAARVKRSSQKRVL